MMSVLAHAAITIPCNARNAATSRDGRHEQRVTRKCDLHVPIIAISQNKARGNVMKLIAYQWFNETFVSSRIG